MAEQKEMEKSLMNLLNTNTNPNPMENQQKEKKGIDVVEGNKLIAEFMGAKETTLGTFRLPQFKGKFEDTFDTFQFEYHSSWDWLMPVVEKIGKVPSISINIEYFTVENGNKLVCYCEIKRTYWPKHAVCKEQQIAYRQVFAEEIEPILLIHEQVIKFIQWHNQTTTP